MEKGFNCIDQDTCHPASLIACFPNTEFKWFTLIPFLCRLWSSKKILSTTAWSKYLTDATMSHSETPTTLTTMTTSTKSCPFLERGQAECPGPRLNLTMNTSIESRHPRQRCCRRKTQSATLLHQASFRRKTSLVFRRRSRRNRSASWVFRQDIGVEFVTKPI